MGRHLEANNLHPAFSYKVCLVWNQLNNKQIESLKQGKISFALTLRRQQAAGLKGDIVLYKSYSEGKFIVEEDEQNFNSYIHWLFIGDGDQGEIKGRLENEPDILLANRC